MNGVTSKLVLAFVSLLIGVVLLAQAASEGNNVTSLTSEVNDTLDVSAARWNATGIGPGAGLFLNSSYRLPLHTASGLDEFGDSTADCPLTGFSLRNDSNGTVSATTYNLSYSLTPGEVYIQLANITSNGGLQYGNNSNNTYISYTFCPDGYITQSFGRTGVDVAIGVFAIALLMVAVGLFYSTYNDWKKY